MNKSSEGESEAWGLFVSVYVFTERFLLGRSVCWEEQLVELYKSDYRPVTILAYTPLSQHNAGLSVLAEKN